MAYNDVTVSGLEEVRKLLDGKRITKELKLKMSLLVSGLHSDIRKEVFTRYKINQDKLNNALVGRSVSDVTQGANTLKSGFIYKHKATPLAGFFASAEFGNINAGAKQKGLVHRVEIRRGKHSIVYGLEHRGGFIPVQKTVTSFNTKTGRHEYTVARQSAFLNKKADLRARLNMYERKSRSNVPLRLLFAPSPAQLVERVYLHSPFIQKRVDQLTNEVTDLFIKK